MLLTSKSLDRIEHSESECQVCHGEVLLLIITLIETPHVCDYFLVTRGQFRGKLFAHPFLLLGIRYYKLYIFLYVNNIYTFNIASYIYL